ncbi:rhodanese-like domain-containing protein [Tsukamurella sp. 8F]|uniref:rhodanese-like domain-containing protein n=1 Tax=unclassified Tsukamurella TaxID=2633480 RepID=UPI0023B94A87|nr:MULTISPECIES: rhodanese-like domain-containing protein [unclassified Tsukamurella]MDF0530937.1 rhodanese-like domain-containing protein [Tsukamurella sp. 8J]MDF0588262.1 rhodanese-like domain-containing protein [Tsukamurella sp. 8F]
MTYAGDLTPTEAWKLLADDPSAVLVDCRTDAEWNYVGVPDLTELGKKLVLAQWQTFPDGALNPRFVADLRRSGVPDGAPVAFICRSGQRSIGAAEAATRAGIGPSYNVLDGFEGALDETGHRGAAGWRADGLPWRQF